MQSAPLGSKLWIVTFVEEFKSREVNDLTGWTSSDNTKNQIKLKFNSKEAAIEYATNNNYDYIIDQCSKSNLKLKSYSVNFLKPIIN
jgi:hypothetical protein